MPCCASSIAYGSQHRRLLRCSRRRTSYVSPATATGVLDSSNSSMRSSRRSEFTVVGLYGSPEYAAVQMLARLVDLPEPQQIRAELGMRGPQIRLHLDCTPQQRRSLRDSGDA